MRRPRSTAAILAASCAAAAAAALVVVIAAVLVLEARSARAGVEEEATHEASDLAQLARAPGAVSVVDGRLEVSPDVRSFVTGRAGTDALIGITWGDGDPLLNRPAARALFAKDEPDGYAIRRVGLPGGGQAVAAEPLAPATDRVTELGFVLLLVGAGCVALAALGGFLAARRQLAPLERISTTARRITQGDLDARVELDRGGSELTEASGAIDAMVDQLTDALGREKQLVADVAHELRTPIAIARGHLEVANLPSGDDGRLRTASELAVSELGRMGRIVDDMLTLARGPDGEAPESVTDVGAVLEHAIGHVGDLGDRRVSVDTETGLRAAITPAALDRVAVNLIMNAAAAGQERGSIDLRAWRDGHDIVITVSDDGPGFPADLLPVAFERSRARDIPAAAAGARAAGSVSRSANG